MRLVTYFHHIDPLYILFYTLKKVCRGNIIQVRRVLGNETIVNVEYRHLQSLVHIFVLSFEIIEINNEFLVDIIFY